MKVVASLLILSPITIASICRLGDQKYLVTLPGHAEKDVPAWRSLQIASIGAHAPSQHCLARKLGILPDRKGSSAACVMYEKKSLHKYAFSSKLAVFSFMKWNGRPCESALVNCCCQCEVFGTLIVFEDSVVNASNSGQVLHSSTKAIISEGGSRSFRHLTLGSDRSSQKLQKLERVAEAPEK